MAIPARESDKHGWHLGCTFPRKGDKLMPDQAQSQCIPGSAVLPRLRVAGRRRLRLLLADDNGSFRDMLVWAFEDEGHEVVAVGNGADLRELLVMSLAPRGTVAPFDVVVTDVRMPGWTGLSAIESLRGVPGVPPVVVVTSFGDDETKERARSAGAVAVVDKPVDPEVLCALVQEVAR
jgi:CheY-like chemotaxis protein